MITVRPLELEDWAYGLPETLSALSPCHPINNGRWEELVAEVSNWTTTFFYVAVYDGQVVGAIAAGTFRHLTRGGSLSMQIEDVAVHREHQGRGVGKALMEEMLKMARRLGCYKVTLDCHPDKVAFYEKLGFFNQGVAMRLNLKEVVIS